MAKSPTRTKRTGRPPKAGVGKRSQFNTRLSSDLKQKLEAEAQAVGRSLSEEIETRLSGSFTRERRESEIASQAIGGIHASFGGKESLDRLLLFHQWAALAIGPGWHKTTKSMEETLGAWKALIELWDGLSADPGKTIEINPFDFDADQIVGHGKAMKMVLVTPEKATVERD